MLVSLGFSRAADLIYSQLISSSPAHIDELADVCKLDAATVISELEQLAASGVVRQVVSDSSKYAAVAPDFAVEFLVQAKEQELRAIRVGVQRLMAVYRSAQAADSTGLVEMIHGSDAVTHAVDQLQMIATTEIRGLTRPPYVRAPTDPNDVGRFKLAKSIRYRGVWDRSTLELPGVFELMRLDISNGEEVRVFDGVPIKLFIADDQIALIPLPRVELGSCDAMVIHPSELLTSLSALFDLIWRSAQPIRGRPDDTVFAESGIDAIHHDVLQMLGAGLTDESIARNLGCSVRTVQRHIRHIMDALGADTRLQAGAAAAKRGWL